MGSMLRYSQLALAILVYFASPLPSCLAETTQETTICQPGRFAQRVELLGGWKRVDLPAEIKSQFVERWPASVQYFQFSTDGKINSMMISNDKDPNLDEATLAETLKNLSGTTFEMPHEGMLVVKYQSIPGFEEHWGVNIFLEDHKSAKLGNIEFKKGDLLLTLDASTFDANARGIVYMRHLRKLQ